VGAAAGVSVVALSAPIAALEARLTSPPLGRGTAVITWTGTSGVTPTVTAIGGQAGHYKVTAREKLARYGQSGSGTTVPDLDKPLPLGDVTGTIGGTAFTLHISLEIPSTLTPASNQVVTLGAVTGSFRGQPVTATLSARTTSQNLDVTGTIGAYRVTAQIGRVQHHGNRSTARATYDVTR
jgi:hypothetical protein